MEIRNALGHAIGAKGSRTRTALMDATRRLMERESIRDIRVADIAAIASTSSATFYRYFKDVVEAALAVAQAVEQMTPEMERLLSEPWPTEEVFLRSRALVEIWARLWTQHYPVLQFRNLAADQGDDRFLDARGASIQRARTLIMAKVVAMQRQGADAPALTNAMLGALERTSANLIHNKRLRLSRARVIDGAAYLVALTFAGSLPAGVLGLDAREG